MPTVPIVPQSVAAVPFSVTPATGTEAKLITVYAEWNGAAASGNFLPCLAIYDNSGVRLGRVFPSSTVTAGDSAVVTYAPFPGGIGTKAASGSGYQFNTGTYGADNIGDWSLIEYTGTVAQTFTKPEAMSGGATAIETFSAGITTADGFAITADPSLLANSGNPVLEVDHAFNTGGHGAFGIAVNAVDATPAGTGIVQGVSVQAQSKSSADSIGVISTTTALAGAGNAYGIQVSAANAGTGKEIGLLASTNGNQAGANSLAILVNNSSGNPIFEVRNDGTVHILTGGVIHADL